MNNNKSKTGLILMYCLLFVAVCLSAFIGFKALTASHSAPPDIEPAPPIASEPIVTENPEPEPEPEPEPILEGAAPAHLYTFTESHCTGIYSDELPVGVSESLIGFTDELYYLQSQLPSNFEDISTLYSLLPDMAKLFSSTAMEKAALWQGSLDFLIAARATNQNDMNLTDYTFSLDVKSIDITGGICTVNFEENSSVYFAYLGGIESITKNLDCSASFIVENDVWKLTSYSRSEDYFNAVERNYNEDMDVSEIRTLGLSALKQYTANMNRMITDRDTYNSGSVNFSYIRCDYPYNRTEAGIYAEEYVFNRNSEDWEVFDELGGNCQNYASQVLTAGGIPMDYTIPGIWKYYGSTPDETESAFGRSPAWSSAPSFRRYAMENSGFGLVSTVDANLFSAETGDIIQVGSSENTASHTNVVADQYTVNGEVIEILLFSNSNNRYNWPLSATYSPEITLIKVHGYNT